MKFDTKKNSTPFAASPEHCFLQDNPYVPSDEESSPLDNLGRQVLYEPSIFYTPIYASQRIFDQPDRKKRLLTKDSMDELNQQLEALFIGESFDSGTSQATPKEVGKKSFDSETTPKEEEEDEPSLGRCSVPYRGRKGMVTVTRSRRLAGK